MINKKFFEQMEWVHNLPYGRNSDRSDFTLVEQEEKGTCSTKHAYLKWWADQKGIKNIELYLCIFKMSGDNTPVIADYLKSKQLDYIPEAHCFIEVDKKPFDITFSYSNIAKLEKYILQKETIPPKGIGTYKIDYHKKYIAQWLKEQKSEYSLTEFWNIREECIKLLSL